MRDTPSTRVLSTLIKCPNNYKISNMPYREISSGFSLSCSLFPPIGLFSYYGVLWIILISAYTHIHRNHGVSRKIFTQIGHLLDDCSKQEGHHVKLFLNSICVYIIGRQLYIYRDIE